MSKTTHLSKLRHSIPYRELALFIALFVFSGLPVSADQGHQEQAPEVNADAQESEAKPVSESSGSDNVADESDGHDHASDHQSEASESLEGDEDSPLIKPDTGLYKAVKYAGKFHVMVLHFPIAFLLGAALVQWFVVFRGKGQTVVAVMLWFGTLGGVAAAALGWMYAYDSVYFGESENILFWHRWLGTGTATLAVVVLLLHNKLGTKGLAVALTACAGLVGIAAHYGASLVYGLDFLFKL